MNLWRLYINEKIKILKGLKLKKYKLIMTKNDKKKLTGPKFKRKHQLTNTKIKRIIFEEPKIKNINLLRQKIF